MSRISALVTRARQSLNPKAPDTTQSDAANQNETPISREEEQFSADVRCGPRTARARAWASLYLAIFGVETDSRDDPENEPSDAADTARD